MITFDANRRDLLRSGGLGAAATKRKHNSIVFRRALGNA
jgi:hypothetical protein